MRREPVRVKFQPEDIEVTAYVGDTLLDAALDNHIYVDHECGGNCTCTTCHVYVESGGQHLSPMEAPENERLDATPLRTEQSRLACQALLRSGFVVATVVFDRTDRE